MSVLSHKSTPPVPQHAPPQVPPHAVIASQVSEALREDIGSGDITAALVDENVFIDAQLRCREHAVLCGTHWFDESFRQVDERIKIHWRHSDGDCLATDTVVCEIRGRASAILSAERTAINFLQTLSATATTTRCYVDAIASTTARIVDTRKTIPGMRVAQKYAVVIGGGYNHRMGLFDQVLIKENHIAAAGSIAAALARIRAIVPASTPIEIEVESLHELQQALDANATRIMLDNFDLHSMREGVAMSRARAELEASGNVALERVKEIADTGVDYISIGALTKHVSAIDFSLRCRPSETVAK